MAKCDLIALAREMMWNPNWPVHAAAALGGVNPLDLLPPSYSWWLRRREEVRQLYPTGSRSDRRAIVEPLGFKATDTVALYQYQRCNRRTWRETGEAWPRPPYRGLPKSYPSPENAYSPSDAATD